MATRTNASISGLNDRADRIRDENRGIMYYAGLQPRGKAPSQLFQRCVHGLRYGDGIGAGRKIDADRHRRIAVEAAERIQVLRAQFDASDVLDLQHRTVRIGADNDRAEFLRGGEAPLGLQVQLELLIFRNRTCSETTDRRLDVLRLHGANDVRRCQTQGSSNATVSNQIRIE